jgi:hypothetical protein
MGNIPTIVPETKPANSFGPKQLSLVAGAIVLVLLLIGLLSSSSTTAIPTVQDIAAPIRDLSQPLDLLSVDLAPHMPTLKKTAKDSVPGTAARKKRQVEPEILRAPESVRPLPAGFGTSRRRPRLLHAPQPPPRRNRAPCHLQRAWKTARTPHNGVGCRSKPHGPLSRYAGPCGDRQGSHWRRYVSWPRTHVDCSTQDTVPPGVPPNPSHATGTASAVAIRSRVSMAGSEPFSI